jgi:hypothetical protein
VGFRKYLQIQHFWVAKPRAVCEKCPKYVPVVADGLVREAREAGDHLRGKRRISAPGASGSWVAQVVAGCGRGSGSTALVADGRVGLGGDVVVVVEEVGGVVALFDLA